MHMVSLPSDRLIHILVPRVLRLLGQPAVAGRDSGLMEKIRFFRLAVHSNKTKNLSNHM